MPFDKLLLDYNAIVHGLVAYAARDLRTALPSALAIKLVDLYRDLSAGPLQKLADYIVTLAALDDVCNAMPNYSICSHRSWLVNNIMKLVGELRGRIGFCCNGRLIIVGRAPYDIVDKIARLADHGYVAFINDETAAAIAKDNDYAIVKREDGEYIVITPRGKQRYRSFREAVEAAIRAVASLALA